MRCAIFAVLALACAPAAEAAVPGVQAHRGGPVIAGVPTYPEETMPAFRNAARNLQVVLELDAKLTADGVPVVIHDPTLDRTTNCEGAVADRTLEELAACRADVLGAPGNDLETAPAPKPVAIPTLAQVLAFAKAVGTRVNLEIKNVPTDSDYDPTPAYANRIMDVVLESGIPADQMIIQSFVPQNLEVAESRMPDAEFALLSLAQMNDAAIDFAATEGWEWVSPAWPIDADYVERAHGRKLKVVPYTINKAEAVAEAAKVGVDALITDDPLMALRTLDTNAPNAAVTLLTKRIERVRRHRRLRVRTSMDEAGTARLTARIAGERVGAGRAAFDRAGTTRVSVALSRRGRRALAERRRARVKLVTRARDVAGNRTRLVKVVGLR